MLKCILFFYNKLLNDISAIQFVINLYTKQRGLRVKVQSKDSFGAYKH